MKPFAPVTLRLFVAVCEERNIALAAQRKALALLSAALALLQGCSPPAGDARPVAASPAASAHRPSAPGLDLTALKAYGFRGSVVTLADGSAVELRSVRERSAGAERLLLKDGRAIDFAGLASIEVLSFRAGDGEGDALLTMADGSTLRGAFKATELHGSTGQDEYATPFERVRRLDFVR